MSTTVRQRLGLTIAGIILIVAWRIFAGGPSQVIQVNFSMDPQFFAGVEVIIDGEVAGVLRPMGTRNVTGFEVSDGEHTIELRNEGYLSESTRFTAGFGGGGPLMADIESRSEGGEIQNILVLRR